MTQIVWYLPEGFERREITPATLFTLDGPSNHPVVSPSYRDMWIPRQGRLEIAAEVEA